MASPYYIRWQRSAVDIGTTVATFMNCVPSLTHLAPQDGVGSFNNSLNITHEYFGAMHAVFPAGAVLWANIETFLPNAQICHAAPESRIEAQFAAVSPFVADAIHFWGYNLPGAPPCGAAAAAAHRRRSRRLRTHP